MPALLLGRRLTLPQLSSAPQEPTGTFPQIDRDHSLTLWVLDFRYSCIPVLKSLFPHGCLLPITKVGSLNMLSVCNTVHWWRWFHIDPGASSVFISKESLATYFSLSLEQQQQFQLLACNTKQHYLLLDLCQLSTALSVSCFHLWDSGLKK